MFKGKTGNPTRVKGNTSFPSLRCLLQAVLEVSCQDVHQEVEQPGPESSAPQDFPLEEAGFISNVLYGLGGLPPPITAIFKRNREGNDSLGVYMGHT